MSSDRVTSLFFPSGRRVPRAARSRGISLIELLVVIFILAAIALIAAPQILLAARKSRLRTEAMNLRAVLLRTQVLSQQGFTDSGGTRHKGGMMFVKIGARQSNGTRLVELVGDTFPAAPNADSFGGNGALDDQDALAERVTLPSYIWLTETTTATTVDQQNWSAGANAGEYVLAIDSQGRARAPGGNQIPGPATLVVTHENMAGGSMRPRVTHLLTISPLWGVAESQRIY